MLLHADFWSYVCVGFLAQMVDGALGMAYGTLSTSVLLAAGVPPLTASASVHTAQFFTTGISSLSHYYFKNVNRRLMIMLAFSGAVGGIGGAMLLTMIDGKILKPWISAYLMALGIIILWRIIFGRKSAPPDRDKKRQMVPLGIIGGFLDALRAAPVDVGAVAAEVLLEGGGHEAGGLPEVPIGCGVALRRSVFLSLGGYDSSFDYYAEEYDLAARLLLAGFRVAYDRSFRVLHRKVASGRDFTAIVERLVRNNAWVEQRYAPESLRSAAVASTLARYRAIAEKEEALAGYARGLATVRETISSQARTPMPPALYDRFTGRAHAREHLRAALRGIDRVALVAPGKHETIVREVVRELGVREVSSHADAHAAVIATLSPGPILDAASEWGARLSIPVITPWALAPAAATPYMLRTA